jgi:DNA-directed RNA polymerase specialized sigma24 family protein
MKTRTNPPESSIWPLTDWTGLGRAAESVGKDAEALNQLILKYRVPLEIHLRATFPGLGNQAEEILQDFSEDKILREGWLGGADRKRGRFRAFLKTSLDNFVKDRLRRNASPPVSLDELEHDPPAEQERSDLFDAAWAEAIVSETLRRMKNDCETPRKNQPNRPRIWEVFRLRPARPMLEGAEPMDYEELIGRCAIRSPAEAQNLLATGKRMFLRHFYAVVAEYEERPDAVKEEIELFRTFLSRVSCDKTRQMQ